MKDIFSTSNLWYIKENIKKLLSKFKIIDSEIISETIAHFSAHKSFNKKYFIEFDKFYKQSDEHKISFFGIISELEQYKLFIIFNKIYALTETPKWLLRMRNDLRDIIKSPDIDEVQKSNFKLLDKMCAIYFENIFNYQYLNLHKYRSNNTPIDLLKFIAEQEGVHPADHWSRFDYRLNAPDRLLLGLTHFKMKDLPVVYIEIALAENIVKKIDDILQDHRQVLDVNKCRVAIFYSVNKSVAGLEGVGLGEKIILKSAEYIQKKYTKIKRFVTLSPIPTFRRYLNKEIQKDKSKLFDSESFIKTLDNKYLTKIFKFCDTNFEVKISNSRDLTKLLLGNNEWYSNEDFKKLIEDFLFNLTKAFLLEIKFEKHNRLNVYDAVENFHLSNGAELISINPFANLTEKGINESLGIMVNYEYKLDHLEKNRLDYHNNIIHNSI